MPLNYLVNNNNKIIILYMLLFYIFSIHSTIISVFFNVFLICIMLKKYKRINVNKLRLILLYKRHPK